MKATNALLTSVLEAYRVASNGAVARGWASRTRSYVSVKIEGRHLSPREQATFNEILRDEFGKEFLSSTNAFSRKKHPPTETLIGTLGHVGVTEKVTARFVSSYEPMKPKATGVYKDSSYDYY